MNEQESEREPEPPIWQPSLVDRWGLLNLEDPDPSGDMPKRARVLDALA